MSSAKKAPLLFLLFGLITGLLNGEPLKILTYNVGGLPTLPLPNKNKRIQRIAERLAHSEYDVICLQELWFNRDAEKIRRVSEFPYAARARAPFSPFRGNGLLILSRLPIIKQQFFPFSRNAPAWHFLNADVWANKGVLAARLEIQGKTLDIYTTHTVASTLDRHYDVVRLQQVGEIKEMAQKFSGNNPFLLMGDFNFKRQSPEYRALTKSLDLKDACLKINAADCGVTDSMDGVIDYVFLSQNFNEQDLVGAKTDFLWTAAYPNMEFSDHQAIGVLIEPTHYAGQKY